MADSKRSLDIVIAAKDETEAGVKSVQGRLDALQQHVERAGSAHTPSAGKSSGGEIPGLGGLGKLHELLEGAGVIAALEGVAKALHGVAEAQEEVEKKGLTGSQAFGKLLEGATDSVPVLSQGIHLFTELRTGVQDAGAALYRLGGGTKDAAESMMSAESRARLYTEQLREQAEVTNRLRAAQEELSLSQLRGRQRQTEELRDETQKEADAAAQAVKDFLEAHGGKVDDLSEAEKTEYKAAQQTALDIKQIGLNKQKELAEQFRHEDEERTRQHYADLRAVAAEGEAAFLGEFSTARALKSRAMADAKEADLQSIRDQAARDAAAHPDQKARIDADAQEKKNQREAKYDLESLAFQHQIDKQKEQDAFDSGQRVLDNEANVQAQKLQMQHRDADAQSVLAQRQYDREEAEVARRLKLLEEAEDNDPSETLAANELAAAQKRAAEEKTARDALHRAEQERLRKQSANDAQDRRAEISHAAERLKIDILRQEAALGNQIAGKQAEQLMLAEKYAEKREEINRLLRDQAAVLSDQQKTDLKNDLARLDALEAKDRARARAGAGGVNGLTLPTASDDSHLTGLAQAAQEQALAHADQQAATAANTDALKILANFYTSYLQPLLPQISSVLPMFQSFLNSQATGAASSSGGSVF